MHPDIALYLKYRSLPKVWYHIECRVWGLFQNILLGLQSKPSSQALIKRNYIFVHHLLGILFLVSYSIAYHNIKSKIKVSSHTHAA